VHTFCKLTEGRDGFITAAAVGSEPRCSGMQSENVT